MTREGRGDAIDIRRTQGRRGGRRVLAVAVAALVLLGAALLLSSQPPSARPPSLAPEAAAPTPLGPLHAAVDAPRPIGDAIRTATTRRELAPEPGDETDRAAAAPPATLRGVAVLPGGAPAGGATVTLRRRLASRDEAKRLRYRLHPGTLYVTFGESRTDADGSFSFAGLDPGAGYHVAVQADWLAGMSAMATLSPGGVAELPPLVLLPAGRVRGVVRTEGGAPLPMASVDLQPVRGDGTFDLGFRAAGTTTLRVTAPRFPTARVDVTLRAGEETWVEVAMQAPAGVVGSVLDPDHRPIPLARLTFASRDGEPVIANANALGRFRVFGVEPRDVTSLEVEAIGYEPRTWPGPLGDGVLDVPLRPRHVIEVEVRSDEPDLADAELVFDVFVLHADGPVQSWQHRDGDGVYRLGLSRPCTIRLTANSGRCAPATTEVEVTDGAAVTRATLELRAGSRLEARVRHDSGAPAADVALTLVRVATTAPITRKSRTDRAGRAAFRGLPPGSYTVSLEDDPSRLAEATLADETSVELVHLRVPDTGSVTLRPRSRDGAGLTPLCVTILGPGGGDAWSHRGEPVRFDGLSPGPHGWRVLPEAYPFANVALRPEVRDAGDATVTAIEVEPGRHREFDLLVDAPATGALTARVVVDGAAIANAELLLTRLGETWEPTHSERHRADAEGRVVLPKIASGRYDVRVEVPGIGGPYDAGELTIHPGAACSLPVAFQTGTVRGRVLDASGAPVSGANVWLIVRSERWSAAFRGDRGVVRTGANGYFAFEEVPIAAYRLQVMHELGEAALTVTPGGPEVEVRL